MNNDTNMANGIYLCVCVVGEKVVCFLSKVTERTSSRLCYCCYETSPFLHVYFTKKDFLVFDGAHIIVGLCLGSTKRRLEPTKTIINKLRDSLLRYIK